MKMTTKSWNENDSPPMPREEWSPSCPRLWIEKLWRAGLNTQQFFSTLLFMTLDMAKIVINDFIVFLKEYNRQEAEYCDTAASAASAHLTSWCSFPAQYDSRCRPVVSLVLRWMSTKPPYKFYNASTHLLILKHVERFAGVAVVLVKFVSFEQRGSTEVVSQNLGSPERKFSLCRVDGFISVSLTCRTYTRRRDHFGQRLALAKVRTT